MKNFEYSRPGSLMEAVSVLKDNPGAIPYAGGTDILVRMKQNLISPPLLVDLKNIPELKGIDAIGGHGLRIGAAMLLNELCDNELIRQRCPVLSEAAVTMACDQVRNRGTVGGNVANASPSADTVPPLIVHNAELEIFSAGDTKRVPIEDFFTGPGESVLQSGDLLVSIHLPDVARKASYLKHTLREAMDIAAVGVCLSRRLEGDSDPRLVLGAVAPTPIRVPEAEALLANGKVDEAAEAAARAARPIDDVRASADYRREVIIPLVKRAYKVVFE